MNFSILSNVKLIQESWVLLCRVWYKSRATTPSTVQFLVTKAEQLGIAVVHGMAEKRPLVVFTLRYEREHLGHVRKILVS